MGSLNLSSSPLSFIMPQTSPFLMPDYANAFKMNMQPQMNNLLFKTGLMTSGSSDSITALNGQNLMNNAINLNDNPLLVNTPSTNLGSSFTASLGLNMGFSALGLIGSRIGGTAGLVMQGVSKVGSAVKGLTDASKAAGGFKNLSGMGKAGSIGAIAGAAADMIGSFMPEKTEYSGDKGEITQTMDSVYDGIADAAMSVPGWGTLVGGIMKGGKLLGQGINALGGGTDGMTTTDAILGSSFLNLTPIGLLNGFGGAKTDTITKDKEAFAQVGSSYTGSNSVVDEAVRKSGKKYGLFSSGAREEANREIAEAKRLQSIITDISKDVLDRMALKSSMSAFNGNRRQLLLLGGYDLLAVRVGRNGMSLELLEKARSILKALKGAKLTPLDTYYKTISQNWETIPKTGKPSYEEWVKDVNPDFINDNYDLEGAYNNFPYELLLKWKFAVNSKNPDYYMDYHENDYYPFHLTSVAPLQGTEDYIFLKKGKEDTNPELHLETDTYHNGLKNTHDLVYEGDRYYYRKKKSNVKLETPLHKNGGSIIELAKESIIELVDPAAIPEFLNGGSINVIPDGALHARKHNMEDADNLTKKGIPVVDNKGELQAEIEKEELIFRLEVTLKLEELEKKYYSEEYSQKEKDEYALEAGKLITEELLHNTKDNAGLL